LDKISIRARFRVGGPNIKAYRIGEGTALLNMIKIDEGKVSQSVKKQAKKIPEKGVKRCVGYMRVSTPGQAAPDENRKHDIPKLQESALKDFFANGHADGIIYKNVFKELGLKAKSQYGDFIYDIGSGSENEARPGFMAIINLLQEKKIDAVVVAYADRLCRNKKGSSMICNALNQAEGMVIEVGGNALNIFDLSNKDSTLNTINEWRLQMALNGATTYSEERSSTARRATNDAFARGIFHTGGKAKYGYRWLYDKNLPAAMKFRPGHYEENPEEADVVRFVFDLYAWGLMGKPTDESEPSEWRGLGVGSIMKILYAKKGIRMRRDAIDRILHDRSYIDGTATFRSLGGIWNDTSVKAMMERAGFVVDRKMTRDDKIYILSKIDERYGTTYVSTAEQTFEHVYPPLIDKRTAEEVSKRLKEALAAHPAPRKVVGIDEDGNPFAERGWLSGMLFCPYCGKPYYRAHKPGKDGKGFYVSGALAAGINCPNQTNVSYVIEDAVFEMVCRIVFYDPNYRTAYDKFCREIKARQAQAGKLARKTPTPEENLAKSIAAIDKTYQKLMYEIQSAIDHDDQEKKVALDKKFNAVREELADAKKKLADLQSRQKDKGADERLAVSLRQKATDMRKLYESDKSKITIAQKEAFVKAFVQRIDFGHPRRNIGTLEKPVYGREYDNWRETGWTDAVVELTMKWVSGVPVSWTGFANTQRKDGLPAFDKIPGVDDDHEDDDDPYRLMPSTKNEDGDLIVFEEPKKKDDKGGSGSSSPAGGSDGSSSGTPDDGGGFAAAPRVQQTGAFPIPLTFLISSMRLNRLSRPRSH
jgi:DNA invertase Pin-like site-specific DNA recombinase